MTEPSALRETSGLQLCGICGQSYDRLDLEQVKHHMQPVHEQLRTDS